MNTPATLPLPMRVKAFLAANPEEQLTALDISIKFSTQHKNVHTQLARAVDSGELVRSRNEDGDYVYTAGTVQLQAATATPSPATAAKKPRARLVDVDLTKLPVASNIPIPSLRGDQNHHADEALDRLTEPGQSIGVPLNASGRSAIRKAISKRHNAGTHRYVARTLENEFRIWRKA